MNKNSNGNGSGSVQDKRRRKYGGQGQKKQKRYVVVEDFNKADNDQPKEKEMMVPPNIELQVENLLPEEEKQDVEKLEVKQVEEDEPEMFDMLKKRSSVSFVEPRDIIEKKKSAVQ